MFQAVSFLEKNKDTLQSNVVELLCESKNSIICQMFDDLRGRLLPKTLSKSTGRYVTMKPRTPTVSAQFNESLASLVYTMKQCNPYFIRCLKPNNSKTPMLFHGDTVMEQLKYTGILQTVNIRKWGYPVRVPFPTFIHRYKCLLIGRKRKGKKKPNGGDVEEEAVKPAEVCRRILLTQHLDDETRYQVGVTKVFLKEFFEQDLEKSCESVQHQAAVILQNQVRAFLIRRKFQRIVRAVIKLQTAIRAWKVRKQLKILKNGFLKAQATYRMYGERKTYQQVTMSSEVSDFSKMEIPGELAHVLSKDKTWFPIHSDQHITTVIGTVVTMDMKYQLPPDINSHQFSKYVQQVFKNPNLAHLTHPIKETFLPLNNEVSKKHAVSIFNLVLRFMGDSKMSDRRKKIIADYIIQKCLQDEQLRDEIYCQLVNQTWKNPGSSNRARGWYLMAYMLCCILPSNSLSKYLLKYVSDFGPNGYSDLCQHKLLQSAHMRPSLCRTYPPCLLEWKAALRKANMALSATFPDEDIQVGHVDSWTTGEKFASHLLDQRNMFDNHGGWSVVVDEGSHFYELMGNDYVLDLISEVEIIPGFPVCKSYTFVYADSTTEPNSRRLENKKPHDPDRPRNISFTGHFPEILPINNNAKKGTKDIVFSVTNPLNQRRVEDFIPDLTNQSPLNNRYHNYKMQAMSSNNGEAPTTVNGSSSVVELADLDPGAQLNSRYISRSPINTKDTDIANSRLNARYTEGRPPQQQSNDATYSEASLGRTSTWANWVDNVFDNALNDHVDEFSDSRSLASRIKGGGKGLPNGPQTTLPLNPLLSPPTAPLQSNYFPLTTNTIPTNVTVPITPGILHTLDPVHLAAAQLAAAQQQQQQLAQQQAVQQQYAAQQQAAQQQAITQALYQMQAQQQNLVQAALQQQQQQNALMQAAVQQQLQSQMLQVSPLPSSTGVAAGLLPTTASTSTTTTTTTTTLNDPVGTSSKTPPKVFPKPGNNRELSWKDNSEKTHSKSLLYQPSYVLKSTNKLKDKTKEKPMINGSIQWNGTNGNEEESPKPTTETKKTEKSPNNKINPEIKEVRISRVISSTVTTSEDESGPGVTINGHVVDTEQTTPTTLISENHQQQQQLVPPPAPLPAPILPVENRTPGTFCDSKGTVRRVRVGKVVWPPPIPETKKGTVRVGKLDIAENLAEEFNKSIGKKKNPLSPRNPVSPRNPLSPKEKKDEGNQTTLKNEKVKSRSLTNTPHLATMRMLEKKLSRANASYSNDNYNGDDDGSQEEPVVLETIGRGPPPPPPAVAPPPPPPPQPARYDNDVPKAAPVASVSSGRSDPESVEAVPMEDSSFKMENSKTRLFPQVKELFLTYQDIPCTLRLRKEVFSPKEKLDYTEILNLVFCQVLREVFNPGCIRISKEQRIKMCSLLANYGVTQSNFQTVNVREQIKRIIVDTAKEWPAYFCRLYPVACPSNYSTVKYLGVSHSGVYMIARGSNPSEDQLTVVEAFKFEDIVEVILRSNNIIQLSLRNKGILLYTKWDKEMKAMIDAFSHESKEASKFAFALKDYIIHDPTLLSFKSKDIIKLLDAGNHSDEGWLYGSLNGKVGFFPEEYCRLMSHHEVLAASRESPVLMNGISDNRSESSSISTVPEGNMPMLEYAIHHFQESIQQMELLKTGMSRSRWTEKDQIEMVKWTKTPISRSLLCLVNRELEPIAVEAFSELMAFMRDIPSSKSDTLSALRILTICHKYPELRDEVYCQLCKQTTNNKSASLKSLIRAWRFFILFAAYNDCSNVLKPYLLKYLTLAATDTSDPNNMSLMADMCLKNLRKTLRFGGRKNVPLEEEILNIREGRMTKSQLFFYASRNGPKESVEIRSSTLVKDIIEEICNRLGVTDTVEIEEYSLYLVINGNKPDARYHMIARKEYFFDITADLQVKPTPYDVIFQRSVWFSPLHPPDNDTYIDLMFAQTVSDFLQGFLFVLKNGQIPKDDGYISEVALLAALLHRSEGHTVMPVIKGLKQLLPQQMLELKSPKPQQWLKKIHEQAAINRVNTLSTIQSKARFMNNLSNWVLFGSTFFKLKSVPHYIGECFLAINKHGIQIISKDDHATIVAYQFSEILSTRRYNSENNKNYLDMKLGNLMTQKISRVETDQCSHISNLIGQYMHVINTYKNR
ncbi:hypothetical protein Ahia01_001221900 [Argonauta hians]